MEGKQCKDDNVRVKYDSKRENHDSILAKLIGKKSVITVHEKNTNKTQQKSHVLTTK